jgi:hypothetical protein
MYNETPTKPGPSVVGVISALALVAILVAICVGLLIWRHDVAKAKADVVETQKVTALACEYEREAHLPYEFQKECH